MLIVTGKQTTYMSHFILLFPKYNRISACHLNLKKMLYYEPLPCAYQNILVVLIIYCNEIFYELHVEQSSLTTTRVLSVLVQGIIKALFFCMYYTIVKRGQQVPQSFNTFSQIWDPSPVTKHMVYLILYLKARKKIDSHAKI